jgi:hypothetical protein
MPRLLLMCAVVVALSASSAQAAGVNLAWDDCAGLGGGASNKFGTATFSCNSNENSAGRTSSIFGSYVLPTTIQTFDGIDAFVYLYSPLPALPPWWDFGNYPTGSPVGCRAGQLVVYFPYFYASPSCPGWPVVVHAAIVTFQTGYGGPSRALLHILASSVDGAPGVAYEGEEMMAFILEIRNAKTVGTGSCSGCETPMCLTLSQLNIRQRPFENPQLHLTNPDVRNFVTWNDAGGAQNCAGIVPTHKLTWGQVKSLYRE